MVADFIPLMFVGTRKEEQKGSLRIGGMSKTKECSVRDFLVDQKRNGEGVNCEICVHTLRNLSSRWT